jgi:hypothetical protein
MKTAWPVLLCAFMLAFLPSSGAQTVIIEGSGLGRTFDGLGAISGGGGNSRLLIDYPAEPQPDPGLSLPTQLRRVAADPQSRDRRRRELDQRCRA